MGLGGVEKGIWLWKAKWRESHQDFQVKLHVVDEGEEQAKSGSKKCNLGTNASRRVRSFRKNKDLTRKMMTLVLYLLDLRCLQVI